MPESHSRPHHKSAIFNKSGGPPKNLWLTAAVRLTLEGTRGTLGKGLVQKIGVQYVSLRFKSRCFQISNAQGGWVTACDARGLLVAGCLAAWPHGWLHGCVASCLAAWLACCLAVWPPAFVTAWFGAGAGMPPGFQDNVYRHRHDRSTRGDGEARGKVHFLYKNTRQSIWDHLGSWDDSAFRMLRKLGRQDMFRMLLTTYIFSMRVHKGLDGCL